jgi:hypothetical protein
MKQFIKQHGWVIGIVCAVLLTGSVAYAAVGGISIENVETFNYSGDEAGMLGIAASASKFTNVEVTNELQTADLTVTDDIALTDDMSIGGDLTVTGAADVSTFTEGGGMFTSSTANATETLLVTAMDTENFIDYTPNVNSTLTLPATSTLSALMPTAGDSRQYIIRNASSTAAATLTLAAGAGMDLQFVEATGGDLVLNGLDAGTLTMTRLTDTDILVLFNEYTEAD